MNPIMMLGFANEDGSKVELSAEVLKRHILALGSSGSGKTALCKVVVEECIRKGIPVIAVDPQGDLASLGLKGTSSEVDATVQADYFSKVDVKIWTPGSSAGIPISLSPSIDASGFTDEEERVRAFGEVGKVVAALAGYDVVSEAGQSAGLAFYTILEYADANDLACETVADFVDFLRDPPAALADQLDPVFPQKDRSAVAKKLVVRTSGPNKLLFDMGYPVDIDVLLGYDKGGAHDNGKTRVSVIYLNTLGSDLEKEAFVAMLANALYAWMLQNPSDKLSEMFYLDEAAPYLPPTNKKQPVCKEPIMKLLRQARKYGVGCLIATQSPGDLDYKGMGQVGTWFIGRIKTDQELAKVESGLRQDANINADAIVRALSGLGKGEFAMNCPDVSSEPLVFKTRYLVSEHLTLDVSRVKAITTQKDRAYYGGPTS